MSVLYNFFGKYVNEKQAGAQDLGIESWNTQNRYGERRVTPFTPSPNPNIQVGSGTQYAHGDFGHTAENSFIDKRKAVLTPFHRELRALSLAELHDTVIGPTARSYPLGFVRPPSHRHILASTVIFTMFWHSMAVLSMKRPWWKHWWAFPRLMVVSYASIYATWRLSIFLYYYKYERELQSTNMARQRFLGRHDEDAKKWNEPPRRMVKDQAEIRPMFRGQRPYSVFPGDVPSAFNYSVYDPDRHLPGQGTQGYHPQTFGGAWGDLTEAFWEHNSWI